MKFKTYSTHLLNDLTEMGIRPETKDRRFFQFCERYFAAATVIKVESVHSARNVPNTAAPEISNGLMFTLPLKSALVSLPPEELLHLSDNGYTWSMVNNKKIVFTRYASKKDFMKYFFLHEHAGQTI